MPFVAKGGFRVGLASGNGWQNREDQNPENAQYDKQLRQRESGRRLLVEFHG
jgi:hypothetical protein